MDGNICDISAVECSQRYRLAFALEKDGKKGVVDFHVCPQLLQQFVVNLCNETDQETLLRVMNTTFTKKWHQFVKPIK
jgi:hypothetical protein